MTDVLALRRFDQMVTENNDGAPRARPPRFDIGQPLPERR